MIEIAPHVMQWDKAIEPQVVDSIITTFDMASRDGRTYRRMDLDNDTHDITEKDDEACHWEIMSNGSAHWQLQHLHSKIMDEFLPNYRLQYHLRFWQHVHCAEIKVQKTNKRQGYHVWHMEHDSHYANRNRVLAWTLYLNDVKEGGETEFLHQSIRVPPVANRFIMWAAYWTHLHRGNPPLSGVKYICTGWIEVH